MRGKLPVSVESAWSPAAGLGSRDLGCAFNGPDGKARHDPGLASLDLAAVIVRLCAVPGRSNSNFVIAPFITGF